MFGMLQATKERVMANYIPRKLGCQRAGGLTRESATASHVNFVEKKIELLTMEFVKFCSSVNGT